MLPYKVTLDCACAAPANAPKAASANSDFFIRKSPYKKKKTNLKNYFPDIKEYLIIH
jgi:hypothetical protein